jgi:hypothetical protein
MGRSASRPSKGDSRPRKSAVDRKRRAKVHHKRLIALGYPEEKLKFLTTADVIELLKRPEVTRKKMAALAG